MPSDRGSCQDIVRAPLDTGELPGHQVCDPLLGLLVEAFSAIAYLTPREMNEAADKIRPVFASCLHREQRRAVRPVTARPVAVIARALPLFPQAGGDG